jgi:flagellar M-ring protein FliF
LRIPRPSSSDLERQAIPYQTRNDGAIILVPKDKVTRLRMKLAEGGLPKGGSVGYEIFDKSDALGATSFVQNINHLRALEGELARTIRSIDRVASARVHLVLPERPLFSRETPGAFRLDRAEAARLARAAACPGDTPFDCFGGQWTEADRVSIVDESRSAAGRRLCRQPRVPMRAVGDERRAHLRAPHARAGRGYRVLGGRSPAAPGCSSPPTSTYNKSPRPRTNSTPKGACCAPARPAKSSHHRRQGSGQVTVNNELPGGQQKAGQCRPSTRPEQEERGNRQLRDFPHHQDRGDRSRPGQPHLGRGAGRRHLRQERQGRAGLPPRAKEELDRIAALVRSAIGFDQKRGDQVEIVNLRFAEPPATQPIAEPTKGLAGISATSPRMTSCTSSSSVS